MPVLEIDGTRVRYGLAGTGPALVLLHAGGASGRQWDRVAKFLGDRYTLLTPDLYGFGETSCWPGPAALTHDDQAGLVARVMAETAAGAALVVGHSYGAATAVRLCLAWPERVAGLVLIEPILPNFLKEAGEDALYEEDAAIPGAFVEAVESGRVAEAWAAFVDRRNAPGTWDGLSGAARERLFGQTEGLIAGFRSSYGNPLRMADCRAIGAPVTVVCGARTTAPFRRMAELCRDAVPGARWAEVPGAGHMSPMTHPEAVAGLIAAHAKSAGKAPEPVPE